MGPVRIVLVLALAVMTLAAAGPHSGKGNAAGDIVKVEWLHSPLPKTSPDTPPCHGDRVFTPGAAEVECKLTADGHVSSCFVVSEQPADCAYGRAALRLAKNLRARATLDGRRIKAGMRVRVPFKFQMTE